MGYVLDDANALWAGVFRDAGETYQPTTLVLFTSAARSRAAARRARTPVPFYCPADQKVYLDLDFFNELRNRFGRQATSPRRTSSPTRSATTSSSRPASRARSTT